MHLSHSAVNNSFNNCVCSWSTTALEGCGNKVLPVVHKVFNTSNNEESMCLWLCLVVFLKLSRTAWRDSGCLWRWHWSTVGTESKIMPSTGHPSCGRKYFNIKTHVECLCITIGPLTISRTHCKSLFSKDWVAFLKWVARCFFFFGSSWTLYEFWEVRKVMSIKLEKTV